MTYLWNGRCRRSSCLGTTFPQNVKELQSNCCRTKQCWLWTDIAFYASVSLIRYLYWDIQAQILHFMWFITTPLNKTWTNLCYSTPTRHDKHILTMGLTEFIHCKYHANGGETSGQCPVGDLENTMAIPGVMPDDGWAIPEDTGLFRYLR